MFAFPHQMVRLYRSFLDVVRTDIPLLLGLDVMTRRGLIIHISRGTVSHLRGVWRLPLHRHGGQVLLQWHAYSVTFTRSELHSLHLNFFHP